MPPERRMTIAEERAARSAARRDRPKPEPPLLRFDRRERALHWVNATLFGILMLTGAALYAGPVSAIVGNREVVRTIHVYSGILLPVPLLLAVLGRRGARLRTDLGRLNRWSRDDARWFRRRHRAHVTLGKFNPGQKLNATFIAAAAIVMLGTGSIMKWFDLFPLDWRTGATFVHDWFALGIWAAVIGHILFAVRDGDALDGMIGGSVPAAWARTKAPLWYEELRS
ncbi:MAG TPA: cytochrome b/b6 domain-containing protein [Acidimicrobiia bacterium]|nr:cytochrome b/b6 domain-containing protein [Acidimicrobiia bacterium]